MDAFMPVEKAMTPQLLRTPFFNVVLVTALLLLVPAIAMRVTNELAWGPGDFVVAGALLLTAGSALVFGRKHITGARRRTAFTFLIVLCLLLIWAELAVGLFH
jgi:hypothetical protein